MDEMMTNVVEEAAVETTTEVAKEVAAEAVKHFDGMHGLVIGLCITGGLAIVGGVTIGAKKVYDKWIKPKMKKKADVEDDFDDLDFDETEEEAEVIDLRETEDKKG